jgi:hypothetical protein
VRKLLNYIIMTQTLDLSKMGLVPMSDSEMKEIDGGSFWTWVAGGVAALVEAPAIVTVLGVAAIADGVYDLGKGIVNGWNSVK